MRAQFTLTPHESKRLIAKGVRELPVVKKALQDHRIIIAGGTTNAYVAEELIGERIEPKSRYTVGIITNGTTTATTADTRVPPFVVTKGVVEPSEFHWKQALPDAVVGDVFIKGANAVDHTGLAAVLASDGMGGTIGAAWGAITQRKIALIVPVGLEKLVPSIRDSVEYLAGCTIDESIGNKIGLMPLMGATVVTELTALETLFGVRANCVGAGGVDGSEGAVVIVIDGEETQVKAAMELIKEIKG